jgi:hypothetical protein
VRSIKLDSVGADLQGAGACQMLATWYAQASQQDCGLFGPG